MLDWTKQMLGFPPEASGLLVSGGSMANLVALAVARNVQAGFDVRREGLQGCRQRLMFYASSEAHSSIQKAVELLGLGAESLRLLPVDEAFRIDMDALKAAITADRAAGHQPACIIASAGTVNSGAVDPLDAGRSGRGRRVVAPRRRRDRRAGRPGARSAAEAGRHGTGGFGRAGLPQVDVHAI